MTTTTTTLKREILNQGNLKCNSLYLYSFGGGGGGGDIVNDFDRDIFQKYIYRERNPARINYFEKLLPTTTSYDDKLCQKIVDYYYYYFNDNNNNNDYINLIFTDYQQLEQRYLNYKQFLFHEYQSFTQRKFLINLMLFMEQKCVNDQFRLIISLIKLWWYSMAEKEVLRCKFIPLAFSAWYKDYYFYKDYFKPIASEKIKNDFYDSFLSSFFIKDCCTIDTVDENVEAVLKKYCSIKQFYFKCEEEEF